MGASSAKTEIEQITHRKPKRRAVNVVLTLFSLIVALAACEGIFRVYLAAKGRNPVVISDALAGWAGRPNLRNVTKVEDRGQFTISTDSDGYRLAYPIGQSPPVTAPAVLLVGDSMVQGVAVNDDETFAWLLARETPYYIVNLGIAGYGTDQELVKLEEFLVANPNLDVKHIIVFICENDFFDVQRAFHPFITRTKPLFHLLGDQLERGNYKPQFSDHLADTSRLFWFVTNKYSMRRLQPYPPVQPGIDIVAACLGEMQRLAAARGAQLHILIQHPLKLQPLFDIRLLEHFYEQTGAVDITQRILEGGGQNLVAYDDAHLSGSAHRRVTSIIEAEILKVASTAPNASMFWPTRRAHLSSIEPRNVWQHPAHRAKHFPFIHAGLTRAQRYQGQGFSNEDWR